MNKNSKQKKDTRKRGKTKQVSRQRAWQLRMRALGLCWKCGDPAVGSLCPKHLKRERERQRKLRGWKKRNRKSVSYKV